MKEGVFMAIQHQYDDDRSEHPKKRSRLIIDIVPELRRRIKIAAAENDLSVQEYVGRILDQVVPPERNVTQRQRKPLDREAVDRLFRTGDAIERAHPGLVFEDSAETLYQIREERMRELENNE
jgi:predicted metal-dependent RNase